MKRQDESKPSAAPAMAGAPVGETPPKSDPAPATAPAAEPPRARPPRDAYVLLCIVIASAAIGTMLFAQLGMSFGLSLGAALGVWALLMLVHKQTQKSAQIAELKAELARARFQGGKPQRPAALRGMRLAPAAGPGSAPDGRPADFGSLMTAPEALQPANSSARPGPAAPAGPASGPQRSSPNPGAAPMSANPGRAGSPPLRGSLTAADPNAQDTISANDAAASIDVSGMRLPVSGPAAPALGNEQVARDDRPEQATEAIRDQWSFRPRSQTPAPATGNAPARTATTVEGDLELVQRKIRELADEVNFVEASRPPKPMRNDPRPNPTTDAIEHSIGALKAAANTMRERPGGLGDFIPKSVMSEPSPPRAPQSALPDLGELVIPETAERIAGSESGAKKTEAAPPKLELPLPDHPLFDLGPASAPPAALPARSAEIARAIETAALDIYLAPIVTLSAHAVGHYEMTAALRSPDGKSLETREEDFSLLGPDVVAKFDSERLQRAASLSVRMEARDKDGLLLTEIRGSSLSKRVFLETIAHVYGARPKVATQLVVVLTQQAIDDFTPSVWQAIRDMHSYGFRFALDRVEHMRTDFAALAVAGFGFIRLQSSALFDGFTAPERFVPPDEIYQRATLAGLSIIADGIVDAKAQKRLLDIGVDLGQGTLFGAPRQVMLSGSQNQSAAA